MKIHVTSGDDSLSLSTYPYFLTEEPDFSGLEASIKTINTTQDGSFFQGVRYNSRDIELECGIDTTTKNDRWVEGQRELLYRMIDPKEEVDIGIENTKGEVYYLTTHPVSFPVFQTSTKNKNFQKFLLQFEANDPFLYSDKRIVSLQNTTPKFSFPMTFNSVTFGEKRNSLIESIYNDGITQTPFEIEIEATQQVTNPYLLNVYTGEQIRLNTMLEAGDVVHINTGRKKEITRVRNGIKEPFYYSLDLQSDFIQLNKGNNVFRFGADIGEEYLKIAIGYKEKRVGM